MLEKETIHEEQKTLSEYLAEFPTQAELINLIKGDNEEQARADYFIDKVRPQLEELVATKFKGFKPDKHFVHALKLVQDSRMVRWGEEGIKEFLYAIYSAKDEECNKIIGLFARSYSFDQAMMDFELLKVLIDSNQQFENNLTNDLFSFFPQNQEFINEFMVTLPALNALLVRDDYPENFKHKFLEIMFQRVKEFLFPFDDN